MHIIEKRFSNDGASDPGDERWKTALWPFRHVWDGVLMSAGGHDQVCHAVCCCLVRMW